MKFDKSPKESTGEYLKISSGESVTGIFRGDERTFYAKWVDQKSVECAESDLGAKFRFRVNFITKVGEGKYEAKIWEQGPLVYNQLKDFNADYPLESSVIKITRQGDKLDTTYTILPVKNGEVTPQLEEILSQVKLHDLEAKQEVKAPGVTSGPDYDEPLPF